MRQFALLIASVASLAFAAPAFGQAISPQGAPQPSAEDTPRAVRDINRASLYDTVRSLDLHQQLAGGQVMMDRTIALKTCREFRRAVVSRLTPAEREKLKTATVERLAVIAIGVQINPLFALGALDLPTVEPKDPRDRKIFERCSGIGLSADAQVVMY
ncbi:MAG TPA: hypothetical protein VGB97_01385 [Candidatus Paceibacterota bacterium]|jgi:hypothetical protein